MLLSRVKRWDPQRKIYADDPKRTFAVFRAPRLKSTVL
jgi:hypothetical protein